jgi:hypothetical protein
VMADGNRWPPRRNGMPSLAHLDNKNTLNAMLNVLFRGPRVAGPKAHALSMNLTRLSDKAVIEYELARKALDRYVRPGRNRPVSELLRAGDHLETCLDAVHRAGVHAEALRDLPGAPKIKQNELPSDQARNRARLLRNSIAHAEEKVVQGKTGGGTGRPTSLIATETTIIAGRKGLYIRYDWLAAWIEKYHDLVRRLIA